MGVDLHVVGCVRGSDVDYGAPLHAQPDYDAMERPRYGMDDLWRLKWGSDDVAIFDASLEYLGNQSLMVEVLMNSNRLGKYTHIRSVCERCAVGVNLVQKQVMAGTPVR